MNEYFERASSVIAQMAIKLSMGDETAAVLLLTDAICSIARNGRVTEDVTHPSRRIVDTLVRLEDLMTSQVPS